VVNDRIDSGDVRPRRTEQRAETGGAGMDDGLGRAFAEALGRKDVTRLKALLHPDVNFKAMTPGRFWEADSSDEVVDEVLLGAWFERSDEIVEVVSIETDDLSTAERVGYRFRVANLTGRFLVEQQAYLEPRDGRIGWLRIMCAGFRPEPVRS